MRFKTCAWVLQSGGLRFVFVTTKVLACALLASTTADGAIDLTPIAAERNVDGVVFKQLIFHEKGRQITYQQPAGWTSSGGSNGLRLTPPEKAQARADIEQSPLPAPQPLDEPTVKLLRDQELKKISGGQEIAVVAEEQSPLRFKGRDTYGLTLSYVLHGRRYKTNVLFANLEDTQLRFRVVAPAEEFDEVFRAFRGSLFTLQGL